MKARGHRKKGQGLPNNEIRCVFIKLEISDKDAQRNSNTKEDDAKSWQCIRTMQPNIIQVISQPPKLWKYLLLDDHHASSTKWGRPMRMWLLQ